MQPFTPGSTSTAQIVLSGSTTQSVALSAQVPQGPRQVRVASVAGNAIGFIAFGASGVAAVAATGVPILPGAVELFTVPASATHVALIGTSGNTMYFTTGYGE